MHDGKFSALQLSRESEDKILTRTFSFRGRTFPSTPATQVAPSKYVLARWDKTPEAARFPDWLGHSYCPISAMHQENFALNVY